jgi:NAD(P)-dependent dehydrogenase (short-subunit alcohol dehydrogenase family)
MMGWYLISTSRGDRRMDLQLHQKLALVSGSTAGIGLAIAVCLAKEGASVVINGRTPARVSAAMSEIKEIANDSTVSGVAVDLSTSAGAEELIKRVPQVDILVNNLGVYQAKPFEETSDTDWARIVEVNLFSGVRLSRHYLPLMKKKNWGRIVFISSESGVNIPVEMIHYGVTKTAQLALARGLAETTAGSGVTVNSVLAGPTMSEGVTNFVQGLAASRGISVRELEQDFFQSVRPSSLLKRFATPEEVASLVAFVCSPLSSAINGAALRADGGVVRSII